MTFADIPLGEPFKDDGVTFIKLSDTHARGPKRHWHQSELYDFDADDEIEEFCRWRLP